MSWLASGGWQEIAAQRPRAVPGAEVVRRAAARSAAAATGALPVVAGLLTPFALIAASLWVWSICSDLGVAGGDFFIEDGIFAHGQVWIALAVGAQALAVVINRRLAEASRTKPVRKAGTL